MPGESISLETPFAAAGDETENLAPDEEVGLFDDEEVNDPDTDEQDTDGETESDEPDETSDEDESDDDDNDTDEPDELEQARGEVDSLTAEGDAAAAMLSKHDISYTDLCTEFKENGELSAASIAALEKAGFTRELVQGYIEGQQSRYYSGYILPIKKAAGGEEEYDSLCDWAFKNLSEKEQARFNKAVESNDIDIALTAVENLVNRRNKAVGTRPELIPGKTAKPTPSLRGFTSLEEMAKAMDDPRYEVDMNYTKKVERRMLASDF